MSLASLIAPYDTDDLQLLALCVWREARGECLDAKRGVVHTILNRCRIAPAEGFKHDIRGNILKPWAFSSFMEGDPNAKKYPQETALAWQECLSVARTPFTDPTGGAIFYFSTPLVKAPAAWGPVKISKVIGGLTFCCREKL